MGGLLSRLYMLDSFDDLHGHHYETDFLRDVWGIRGLRSNFGAGDVHKFVSVNSPHYGSQVSDLLVTETNDLTPIGFIAQMWADYDLQTGAPFDLRTDSDIISVINSTVAPRAIPSHAICGQYWLPPGPPTRPYDARTYMLGKACGYPVDFIFGGPNDLVVSTDSQLGGFGSSTSSTITGIEGRHYPTVHDYPLGMTNARAVTLLNAPASSSLFAPGFPLTAGPYPAAPSCLAAIDVLPEPSLEISLGSVKGSHVPKSVAPVDTVLAGALLQIDVSVLDGFSPAELFIFVGNDTLAVVDHAPCSVQLPAPNDLVGIVTVRAVAVDGDNRWAHADSVTVAVAPAGPLVSIRTQSPQITLTGTSCRSTIEVYGIYSDGIERYIDPGFIPVAFNILAPGVVSVSNLGRIEAIGAGSAFVQVAVGTVSTLVAVTSTGTCQYPSAIDDGDEPQWDGIPRPFALMQNAPNPFNPNTEICFNLERNGHATLEIFDVRGRRICVLHDGPLGMGRHTVRWNGQDGAGRPAASGMYFYRLRAGDQIAVRKMLMLR
jgi:hypothetical protein